MSNTDTTTQADSSGINRTSDGTIVEPGTTQSSAQTTETKTEGTQSTEGKTVLTGKTEDTAAAKTEEGKKEEPKSGAPEKYADFKLPKGVKLDPASLEKALPIFKELGLSQESAQKLIDLNREIVAAVADEPRKAYQAVADGWLKEAKDHPDLRGKLDQKGEVTVRIGKLLDSIPDAKLASDFRGAMDLTLVGNHPAFIRVMDWFAQQLTEGTHVAGNGPSPGGQSRPGAPSQPSAAQAMWPNLKSAGDNR